MTRIYPLILIALLSACASTPKPPTVDIHKPARDAVAQAVSAGAEQHAPLELRFAREKLQAAEQATLEGDEVVARRLVRQAQLDAELSMAKAEAAIARNAVRSQREANDELRVELEAGQ